MSEHNYATPAAFRRALTDRLRGRAREGKWSLPQLQRQIAYDRLLQRLYLLDNGWIVKGATALLARELGMRATIDVDLYRAAATSTAEHDLRDAVQRDIGDWFRFDIGAGHAIGEGEQGVRLPITAHVGTTSWASFHVDLVGADLRMTSDPEAVPPIAGLAMPNLVQHGYLAYPLCDHLADKVVATFQRYGPQCAPSTRFKDLIDIVAIVQGAALDAVTAIQALRSESHRRAVDLPDRFDVPDRALWQAGYAAEARRSAIRAAAALADALAIVRPCLDPLLTASATGTWQPRTRRWVSEA